MGLLDLLLHLGNLVLPPLAVAALLLLLAKGLVWRELLRGVSWGRLYGPMALLGCAGQLLGLLLLGHEGKLAAYALWLSLLSLPLAWRLLRA
jgi:hypothetical protein